MAETLTKEQLDELFSSDPSPNLLTDQEADEWFAQGGTGWAGAPLHKLLARELGMTVLEEREFYALIGKAE